MQQIPLKTEDRFKGWAFESSDLLENSKAH
jgi:hypothetical protein